MQFLNFPKFSFRKSELIEIQRYEEALTGFNKIRLISTRFVWIQFMNRVALVNFLGFYVYC